MRNVLLSWGIQIAPSRFSCLRFTSVGVFPDLLRILIRNPGRTVAFRCSAPALSCHRCIRFLHIYGLKIRPFAWPFLAKSTESSFFYLKLRSEDLHAWRVPLGCDIPNNLRSSSLSSSKFANSCSVCSMRRNMSSMPSYGTGSYLNSLLWFLQIWDSLGHCSHIVQTSSWLGTFLNKSILIMSLLVTVLTQFKPRYWLVPVLNIIVILTLSGQCSHAVQTSLLISSLSQ